MAGTKTTTRGSAQKQARPAGFTLLELIVVITILGILVAIALPNYKNSILQAKEAVLRENLYRLRDLIDQYQSDKGRYPESLDALVTDGYLRKVPEDPVSRLPWVEVPPEFDEASSEAPIGIYDIKSASSLPGMNGIPYSEW